MNTLQEFLIKSAGMEKAALDLATLLRMSRNAARRGKLQRFSNLLDKRNAAIPKVQAKREAEFLQLYDQVVDNPPPKGGLNYIKDVLKLRSLSDRMPRTEYKDFTFSNRQNIGSWNDPEFVPRQLHNDLYDMTEGPWTIQDLARYGSLQNAANRLDKPTFPI